MGLLDSLAVGRRAIGVASSGIDVTSQNISNVNTVGYTRRKILQQTPDPALRRGVFVGTGVEVSGISRATDRLLNQRLVKSAGQDSHARTLEESLTTVQGLFNESAFTGMSEAWGAMYDAMSRLTTNPADISLRRMTVESGRAFASSVSRIAQGLTDTIGDTDADLTTHAQQINDNLAEIATLNSRIARSGYSTGAGDLLDRRDQLVYSLGERIGATVSYTEDGQAVVFIGDQAVVDVNDHRQIRIAEDAAGDAQVYVNAGTGAIRVTESVGGVVGGKLEARQEMANWLTDLDNFATTFATTMNAQHAAGFDAYGAAGGDMFTIAAVGAAASFDIDPALAADPNLFATAGATPAAVGDTDNLVLLLDTEAAALYGPAGTLDGSTAISTIISDVGSTVASAGVNAEAFGGLLADLSTMRDSVSQVDTDEEAIKLIEFQAAYRAAARVLQASDELLQTLMSIGA